MTRRKLDQKKVEEKREENKLKAFFMDNKKIVKYSLIGLLAISLSAGAISLALRNDNKDKGKVGIESSKEPKETQKETNKETQIEVSKEIEKEINKEIEEEIKKIEDKGLNKEDQEKEIEETKETKPSKPAETKPTQPSKPKETKKEVTRTTETKSIDFKTIDNFAHTNGKSRVYQEGRNGERTIVKEDGKIVSDTITRKPQDKIIERYVKVQDKKTETREVEDKNSPIYDYKSRDRWFVNNDLTGEKKYFYSSDEAYRYFEDNKILGNWGTAEPELIKGDLIGYDKVKKEIVVQEEKWEWKH